MRIAYVITRSDSIGGAHVHVRDLSLHLRALGHEAVVLVGGEGPFTEELSRHEIPFHSLRHLVRPISPLTDVRAVVELRKRLRAIRPDIVSTHSSKAGWVGRLAARTLRIPVVFTAHGWAFTEGVPERERRMYARAERWVAPLAHRIITVSEHDRQIALKERVAREDKLVAVHNGMPDIPPSFHANPGVQPPRIVMVARFEPQKDHETLFEAVRGLTDLPWTLELIGDGPTRASMERLADEVGIADRVEFAGVRRDVDRRLADAQLFVLVSKWEGFPRTILEAMRAGLPVIASNVGGVTESVAEGKNGYVVPRGDANALRERLRTLLVSPELRIQMGAEGRKRYEAEFTFERMLEKTLAVYERVLTRS